jgi:hypothetical protein
MMDQCYPNLTFLRLFCFTSMYDMIWLKLITYFAHVIWQKPSQDLSAVTWPDSSCSHKWCLPDLSIRVKHFCCESLRLSFVVSIVLHGIRKKCEYSHIFASKIFVQWFRQTQHISYLLLDCKNGEIFQTCL